MLCIQLGRMNPQSILELAIKSTSMYILKCCKKLTWELIRMTIQMVEYIWRGKDKLIHRKIKID